MIWTSQYTNLKYGRGKESLPIKDDYIILRRAQPKDIVPGAVVYIDGDFNELYKRRIDEAIVPTDRWKAFVADDGCRYGLENCYIKDK